MTRKKTEYGIRKSLRKHIPYLIRAQEQNMNEADTVFRVVKICEEVLGYDPLKEISRETQIKRKYIDLVLKIDNVIKLLIEVKAAGIVKLRDRHIEQAYNYASRNNYRWILLTNGVVWNLYHLTFEKGIEFELAFSIDLGKDDYNKAVEYMSILHRDCIKSNGLEKFWEITVALASASIGKALFHEDILMNIRREIKRRTGILIDTEDIALAIRNMFSQETREQIGPLKIWKKRRQRKPTNKSNISKTEPEHISDDEST